MYVHPRAPARDIQCISRMSIPSGSDHTVSLSIPFPLYIPSHAGANGLLRLLPPPSSLASVAVSSVTSSLSTVVSSSSLIPRTSGSALSTGLLSATLPHAQTTSLSQLPPVLVSPELLSCSRPGLILSPARDPIPQSLVQRDQSGEFLDMRDLLADNIALMSQLSSLQDTLPL